MSQDAMETATETAVESARRACRATDTITDAIDDSVSVVRHTVRQGCNAAEEFLNDTAGRLQRHLALTVVATFAVGAMAGAIIGRVLRLK